jgi:small-conductance mechanosensitive channel
VVTPEGTTTRIDACGRRVLDVGPDDGAWEGRDTATTAAAWADEIRAAFDAEKRTVYSGELVRRALLGLLYPLLLVAVLALLRWGSRHLKAALLVPRPGRRGLKVGPIHVLETSAERVFLARFVGVLRWALSIAFAYGLTAAMFRQLPGTREWAAAMVRPLAGSAASLAEGLVLLLPRLLVLGVLFAVLRLIIRGATRLFDQVRRGDGGLGALVTPETATPVEKTVKIVAVLVALVLAALILPGLGRQTLGAALLLAGLALALGAQQGAADLIAGLVVVYGRPFRTGQRIRVAEHEGTVVRKGLLHTVLHRADGSTVLVPNRLILSEVVILPASPSAAPGTVVERGGGNVAP